MAPFWDGIPPKINKTTNAKIDAEKVMKFHKKLCENEGLFCIFQDMCSWKKHIFRKAANAADPLKPTFF